MFSNRTFFKSGSSLIDISAEMNDYLSGTKVFAYLFATDFLYLGSELPFNHRFFHVKVVNDLASVANVELWDGGSVWNPAVEVVDGTIATAGKSLSQSGIIQFTPDRNKAWGMEDTTEHIDALSTLRIYNLYWMRFSWSANLKSTTELHSIGHKFASDTDLAAEYPDLIRSSVMTAFESGKTNWDSQHFLAAEYIIGDLKRQNVIISKNQILEWEKLKSAAVHRVAAIIYTAFGKAKEEEMKQAFISYKKTLDVKQFSIDKNADALEQVNERFEQTGWMTR